ncbi:MAG TPA: class II aldolase/adducin family protein [Abditibacteriaceae bacterium]|jgi:rhamnose utilization protein RhaD (predicted bifunctional aldolase and dehydrogenase)
MISQLLQLSHELGREERSLAILGEGNTSMRLDEETFAVKASGSNLATLSEGDVSVCRFDSLLPLLDETTLDDAAIDAALFAARVDDGMKKPSVEALFHAYFLSLPGVDFVGHTHATAVNGIGCSPRAGDFATNRLFPDEIVCCGPSSVFVPYTDPGLKLAQEIRTRTNQWIAENGRAPRIILLENHGLVALGPSPAAVLAATLMAEKSARIFLGAATLGGPKFLTDEQIARIAGRPDEAYRQRALGI